MDGSCALGKVEQTVALFNLGGIGGKRVILRNGGDFSLAQACKGLEQSAGTQRAERVVQIFKIIVFANRQACYRQHIARIQTDVHFHNGNAAFGTAVNQHALHRGGAAIGRQQRAVNVDTAVLGEIKHRLGQNFAVGNHHDDIGCQRGKLGIKRAVLQRGGLIDRQTLLQRIHLDGGRGQLISSALGLVGLGNNAHNLLACLAECAQGKECKVGRAHK